jgi:serine/threonine protein kinase
MPLSELTAELAPRYLVHGEAGAGGVARVLRATDTQTGATVAIKVLHPELSASVHARRFAREIQVLARLRHANVLAVLDAGTAAHNVYYVMPFVDGESLRQRLDRVGALPLEEALQIARDIASALDHAHGMRVVHRDVKPDNIMIERGPGRALLCDFGIARALEMASAEQLTRTGMVVGTPEYISPEQVQSGRAVDGRADIYSLGCILYEMLTGQAPFVGPTPQVIITRHIHQAPRSVRVMRPDVPEPVERAIHAAMAKRRDDRPSTGAELVRMLEEAAV